MESIADYELDSLEIGVKVDSVGALKALDTIKKRMADVFGKRLDFSGLSRITDMMKNKLHFTAPKGLKETAGNLVTLKNAANSAAASTQKLRDVLNSVPEFKAAQSYEDVFQAAKNLGFSTKAQSALANQWAKMNSAAPTRTQPQARSDTDSDNYRKLIDNLDRAEEAFREVGRIGADAFRAVGNVAGSAGRGILNAAKGAGSLAKSGLDRVLVRIRNAFKEINRQIRYFTGALKSMLTFSAFYGVMTAVSESIKTGTENLYQWSKTVNGDFAQSMDRIAGSLQYVQNSIAAMTAPLVNTFAPVLDQISDTIVNTTNQINQMIAALSGASSWTKAVKVQKEYAEAADAAAKANRRLLAGFDELNVIQSAAGTGSATTPDYGSMFQTIPLGDYKLPDIVSRLKEMIKAGDWAGVGALLAEKLNGALSSANIESASSVLGEKLRSVVETVKAFFVNLSWEDVTQAVSDSISGLFSGLGLDGIGSVLSQAWAGVASSAQWLWNEVLSPFASWVSSEFAPVFGETLTLAMGLFSAAAEQLQPVWDTVLKPLAEWTGEGIIKAVGAINEVLAKLTGIIKELNLGELLAKIDFSALAEVLLKVAAAVGTVTAAVLLWKPLVTILNTIASAVKIIGTVFAALSSPVGIAVAAIAGVIAIAALLEEKFGTFSTLIEGVGEKFKETWAGVKESFITIWDTLKPYIEQFGTFFGTVFSGIATVINGTIKGIMDVLNGLVKFFAGVFSGDLSLAVEGICKVFEGITRAVTAVAKGAAKIFVGLVNAVIDAFQNTVNWIISGVNSLFSGVEYVADKLGIDVNIKIPEIDLPHIPVPSFADGGFVDRGQLFLAREAGPELVGSIGSRTAVANNAQIIAGIREGVAQGMRDAGTSGGDTALLREAVALLRDIREKELVIAPSVSMGRMIEKSSRMYAQAIDGRY